MRYWDECRKTDFQQRGKQEREIPSASYDLKIIYLGKNGRFITILSPMYEHHIQCECKGA